MARRRHQGHVERDDISFAQELLERYRLDPQGTNRLPVQVGVVANGAKTEWYHTPQHLASNLAKPNQAKSLAREARHALFCTLRCAPVPGSHLRVQPGHTAESTQDQRGAMVGNLSNAVVRGIGHHDTARCRGVQVDRIDPNSVAHNQPTALELTDLLGRETDPGGQDHLSIADGRVMFITKDQLGPSCLCSCTLGSERH